MKKLNVLLLTVVNLLVLGCSEFDQRFSHTPKFPKANQEITIRYNPKETELEAAEKIEMLVYEFSDKESTVSDVPLESKGESRFATFVPDTATLVMIIQFQAENVVDKNNYQILLYGNDGKYLPGALAVLSSLYLRGGYPLRMERDVPLALTTLQQDFGLHPTTRGRYQELYWNLILLTDQEKGKDRVTAQLDSIASQDSLSLDEKKLLADWYSRLGYEENAEMYKKEIRKTEPTGYLVQSERFSEFRSTTDLEKKLTLFRAFKQEFPESKYLPNIKLILLEDFVQSKQYAEAQNFLEHDLIEPTAYDYNTLAWNMVENEVDLETALKLSEKAVALARSYVELPISEKPKYLTERQWRNGHQTELGNILDTYAFALYKLNRAAEAVPYFEESVQLTQKAHHEINERYAQALSEINENEKAYRFLESLLKEGKSTEKISELFKQSYLALNPSNNGLDSALSTIKTTELANLKSQLEKQMLNRPAPDFTLDDLTGRSVSLKDYRGKTVVIDFWATWCGPCIRSFPGMQKAVDKFKTNDSVKFLFINAWERGGDVKNKVVNFIKEKNYAFHVLLDSENKVVSNYGVEGIPTKFVIDKNGKIRFMSVGFQGTDEKLVDELSVMIELVR